MKYDLNIKSQSSINFVLGLQTVSSKLFADRATDINIHRFAYRTINSFNENSTEAIVLYNA